MNIEKLEVGQTIKNYKEMCMILGEKPQTSNSKKAQLKEWQRYISFSNQGHKFIIEDIYNEPLEKISNNKGGNRSIYGNLTQLLVVDMLMRKKEQHVSISKSKLIEALGITNENYGGCKSNLNKLSQYLSMDIKYIYDFYNINDNNFTSIINTALKNLEDKRIIMCETIYKVKLSNSVKTRKAEDWELELIRDVENSILDELGFRKVSEVRKSKHWQKFKVETKRLIQEKSNIEYYYKAYDIHVNQASANNEKDKLIKELMTHSEKKERKSELNNLVLTNIHTNAEKRVSIDKCTYKNWEIRLSGDYVKNTDKLSDLLVNHSSYYLIPEIMNYNDIAYEDIDEMLPF